MSNLSLVASILKANLSLKQILVAGMAFPVDARFFDNYPFLFGKEDVADRKYPHKHSEYQERMTALVSTYYSEKLLEPKTSTFIPLGLLKVGRITTVL